MTNGTIKKVALVMAISLFAGISVVPVKAEVVSGLDTAEESFFGSTSGTSADMNGSTDNFFDNTQQTGGTSAPSSDNTQQAAGAPSTPATSTSTETNNSNNTTYYYYYTTAATTPAQSADSTVKSEPITLNGTQTQKTDAVETVVSLKKPQIATVVGKKKAALVCLQRSVKNADGYQIQLCKSSSFKKGVTQLRTVLTTKTVKTNASGKFYVRVRAYKIVNGKTTYSAWSPVKTVKIK